MVAAAVIVAAVLAVMFLRGGAPDVAVEEDESLGGVEVILEYVNAVNEGDLARQRELTDPESEELAGVFDDRRIRSMEWSSLVMLERVTDCRLVEGTTVGDTYECGYERENKIGEALGGARRYGTVAVLVSGGMVSSFQPMPFADSPGDIGDPEFLNWALSVHPEVGVRLVTRMNDIGDDDLARLFDDVMEIAGEFMALPLEERSVPRNEDLDLSQTWFSQTGFLRLSPQLWRDRLDRACREGVWDYEVARSLAEEFIAADAAYKLFPEVEGPYIDDGARALWLTAVNYCPDDFPPEAIEEGPPQS